MLASSSQPANSTTILASSAESVTFVGATNVFSDSATSLTHTVPAGTQVNDRLVVFNTHRTNATISGPAGWTALFQNAGSTLTQRGHIKNANSTDISNTHTFTFGSTPVKAAGVMLAFRGIETTSPIRGDVGAGNASAATITVPGLTMAAESVLLIAAGVKATSDPHSSATGGWTLNAAATAASTGTGSHRVSVHYKLSDTANPPGTTIAAGATSAISIGYQGALAASGVTITDFLTASPGSYALAGIASQFVDPAFVASAGLLSMAGSDAAMEYDPIWDVIDIVGIVGSYNDVTAAPETTYVYRVVAVNAAGETISNEDQATTFPAANFQLTADPDAYGITPSDADLVIEQLPALSGSIASSGVAATLDNPPLVWEIIDTVGGGVGSYSDIGLDPGTGYLYRVIGVNTGGESTSNLEMVFTPEAAVAEDFPAAPSAVTLIGLAAVLSISIPASAGSHAITGSTATVAVAHEIIADPGSYDLTGLLAGLLAAAPLTASAGSVAVTGVASTLSRQWSGQQAVPVADVSDGAWTPSTGVDLYATIDEATDDVPVDTDYITTVDPVDDEAVVDLSDLNPPEAGDVHMMVRTRKL